MEDEDDDGGRGAPVARPNNSNSHSVRRRADERTKNQLISCRPAGRRRKAAAGMLTWLALAGLAACLQQPSAGRLQRDSSDWPLASSSSGRAANASVPPPPLRRPPRQDNHDPPVAQQQQPGANQSTWAMLVATLFEPRPAYESDAGADADQQLLSAERQPLAGAHYTVHWPNLILALLLILLMLTTAIGNLFVIVAILIERNLRTIGNYLVLSLAIADLLVALLVMPLASIYLILDRWYLGVRLCDIWTSADVFCCTGE
jgi:hypothetical protein